MLKKGIKIKKSKNMCQHCHQKDCLKTIVKEGNIVVKCIKCGYEKVIKI